MGLRMSVVKLIEKTKPHLPAGPVCYMIGTEDCRFTFAQLSRKYPGLTGSREKGLCDLGSVFKMLGFKSVVTVDMNDRADVKTDITGDFPEGHSGKADLVCELGTLEHILDIKSAIFNMNRFLKRSGIIFHMSPVSSYRHGFVNFNPALFDSLYMGSGYKLLFRTMNMTLYNPFYVINIEDIPRPLRILFAGTNKIFQVLRLRSFNFNLPVQHDMKGSRLWRSVEFCMTHFGAPKHTYYCCAYQKLSDSLKVPYDIWE